MLIAFPAAPAPRRVEWSIEQPAQANRSKVTGKRRVTLLSQAPRMYAKVTIPPIRGEDNVLDWRAFVFDCDGIANSFRLYAGEKTQIDLSSVVVKGAGQGGRQLVTSGWGSAGLKLRRGHFITLGEQLLSVQAPIVANAAGEATISLKPYVRIVPADGASVEVRRPYAVMAMSDPRNGWAVDIGQDYAISFDCEEAF